MFPQHYFFFHSARALPSEALGGGLPGLVYALVMRMVTDTWSYRPIESTGVGDEDDGDGARVASLTNLHNPTHCGLRAALMKVKQKRKDKKKKIV